MNERKYYVVDLDAMEVREILIDDGIEFEIIATPDEVKEIEILFDKMKDDSIESLKSILIPFNEQKVDAERESYDSHLISIFRMIYDLATEKSKSKVVSLTLFEYVKILFY